MPTYNDSDTIMKSLLSLKNQSYENWELIIIDDGSTDSTKEVINEFSINNNSEEKIQYIYQKNNDQLNAIKRSLDYITGDYIYILHSDDLLMEHTFQNFIEFEKSNPNFDAYTGNRIIIDENDNISGKEKTLEYKHKEHRLALLYLWLGRNLYIDFAFWKKDIFLTVVKESYLNWNMPYWINIDKDSGLLNVVNMGCDMFKYRVHSENYINNKIGKLNVINGEIRTVTRLMEFYRIPIYKFQFIIFRIFNKLKLTGAFRPIYFKSEEKNKYKILKFILKKRFSSEYEENIFLNSLLEFYKNKNSRTIFIDKLGDDVQIYQGSDMRKFNLDLLNNNLPNIYNFLFEEMKKGFSNVSCNEEDIEKIIKLTKFLCIYPYVKIN